MDFLQNLEPGSLLLLALLCAGLCGGVVILFFGLQIVGTLIGILTGLFEAFTSILAGGPASWCGCLVLLLGCGFCGVLSVSLVGILQGCGTADQVMLCRVFGY